MNWNRIVCTQVEADAMERDGWLRLRLEVYTICALAVADLQRVRNSFECKVKMLCCVIITGRP